MALAGDFSLPAQPDCFHNALRRALLAHVPVWGVTKVEVLRNTSLLPDEVLAWRVQQVVLRARAGAPAPAPGAQALLYIDARADDAAPLQRLTTRAIEVEGDVEVFHGEGGDGGGMILATLGPGQVVQLAARCVFDTVYALRPSEPHAHASHTPVAFVALEHDASEGEAPARLRLESAGHMDAAALVEAARLALLRRLDNLLVALEAD